MSRNFLKTTLPYILILLFLSASSLYLYNYDRPANRLVTSSTKHLFKFSWEDTDLDGLPDGLQLFGQDQQNFRRWFTLIAEYQSYKISPKWHLEQQDCAGLVRFSMREALKKHNRVWLKDFGADAKLATDSGEDVRAYNFDNLPTGDRLFRTKEGSFKNSDLKDGTLSQFADARTLKTFNTRFISRNLEEARSGDLLFFYDPRQRNFPFHVMIFLGQAVWEDDGYQDWVVYHTGSQLTNGSPQNLALVKKVRLAELKEHPDYRWHPVKSNPSFLGFYRLKLIDN